MGIARNVAFSLLFFWSLVLYIWHDWPKLFPSTAHYTQLQTRPIKQPQTRPITQPQTRLMPYDGITQPQARPIAVRKKILFWVPFFSSRNYYFGFGHEPFLKKHCAVDACETTDDRSLLSSSDAVVFHIPNIHSNHPPPERLPHQRWIFFTMESPPNLYSDLKQFPGPYNWTMTYRTDSDVVASYYEILPKNGTKALTIGLGPADSSKSTEKKRWLVSWLVSHCNTPSKREKYVAELQKHIPVDIYGACGKPCPLEGKSACLRYVMNSYKFYLSFENSACRDYVTEKFSNALQANTVPVVYGGADYARLAPPHSFIDVRNFSSPQHLANYLLQLDSNKTLYDEYFRWKEKYVVTPKAFFCDLCTKLHETDQKPKSYQDIRDWWHEGDHCQSSSFIDSLLNNSGKAIGTALDSRGLRP